MMPIPETRSIRPSRITREVFVLSLLAFGLLNHATAAAPSAAGVLRPDSFKHYIDTFNARDNELYVQHISNAATW